MPRVTVQAEDTTLTSGFVVENHSAATGGQVAGLFTGDPGTSPSSGVLEFAFSGADGTYGMQIGLFDENDGASQLTIEVNGSQVGTYTMDENLGSGGINATTRTSFVISDLNLSNGDTVRISATQNGTEWVRIDEIVFDTDQATLSPTPTPTPTPAASDNIGEGTTQAEDLTLGGSYVAAVRLDGAQGNEVIENNSPHQCRNSIG